MKDNCIEVIVNFLRESNDWKNLNDIHVATGISKFKSYEACSSLCNSGVLVFSKILVKKSNRYASHFKIRCDGEMFTPIVKGPSVTTQEIVKLPDTPPDRQTFCHLLELMAGCMFDSDDRKNRMKSCKDTRY